jgi:hypothetical protein
MTPFQTRSYRQNALVIEFTDADRVIEVPHTLEQSSREKLTACVTQRIIRRRSRSHLECAPRRCLQKAARSPRKTTSKRKGQPLLVTVAVVTRSLLVLATLCLA